MTTKISASMFIVCFLAGTACEEISQATGDASTRPTPTTPAEFAAEAALSYPACQTAAPFYWEIGTTDEIVASGSVTSSIDDTPVPHRTTQMAIASSTKWLFGAWVLETTTNTDNALPFLTMSAGYSNLRYASCIQSATVSDCLNEKANDQYFAEHDGSFFYDGGHFQEFAVLSGLGDMTNSALATEFSQILQAPINFGSPQLAAGARMSAADYAAFLTNILSDLLSISDYLGADAVCTKPKSCINAVSSPAPDNWKYSWGHWVEDDQGDSSFSSPGAFGFYPWINTEKTHYGILARYRLGLAEHVWSSYCGAAIRQAYFQNTLPR